MTSPSALEWTSQSIAGSPPPGYLLILPVTPLSQAFESTNPTWGLRSLQAPLTGGKAVGNEGALGLEALDLALELLLLLPMPSVSLDLGVQPPVVERPGGGRQIVEPLGGAREEPVVPYWHGLDRLVDDLRGGGIEGSDVHVLVDVAPREKVGVAIISTSHPFGLDLESLCDGDECGNFALIGLEIVGTLRLVRRLVFGEAGASFLKTFLGRSKPALDLLELFCVSLVAPVKGLQKSIDEAPQIFGGHLQDSQRRGSGSWGEGEREVGGILVLLNRWRYG